jgi:hypothetical protein
MLFFVNQLGPKPAAQRKEINYMLEQIAAPQQRYRLKGAADYILMSPAFLRKAHRNGTGPDRIRCGSKVILFEKSALDAWLESRKEVSTSPNP